MLLLQDCVCVVQQLLPFIHSGLNLWKILTRLEIWMLREGLMFCMRGPFFSLRVPYVPLVMGDTTLHKDGSLVFFSTFESISLTPESCMQRKGAPMLYERAAAQVPSLYVCPLENVLGRVPLIPCYLNGNSVNTIPHCFRGKIPREAAADSRPDSETGSRLFEINM